MDKKETYEATGAQAAGLGKIESALPPFLRKKGTAVLVLLLCAVLSVAISWINAPADLVQIDRSQCVIDSANILSDETTAYMENLNVELSSSCYGAQIGVMSVKTTGRTDIESYAEQAFKEWGPGDKNENNGVLLLLVPGDDNYYCATGKGLVDAMPSGTVSALLYDNLEQAWVEGSYDAGVQQTCLAIAQEIALVYGVSLSGVYGQGQTAAGNQEYNYYPQQNVGFGVSSVGDIVSILIFVVMYFFMIRPQTKKQKELQKQREAMKKGDKVVTAGGIYGEIKEVQENAFIITIAKDVTIKVSKDSVFVDAADAQAAPKDEKK